MLFLQRGSMLGHLNAAMRAADDSSHLQRRREEVVGGGGCVCRRATHMHRRCHSDFSGVKACCAFNRHIILEYTACR